MRVCHIVGMLNGWAIQNRARALERALLPDVAGTTRCYRDIAAIGLTHYAFLHVHGLQLVPLIKSQLVDCSVPWGFEVISERSLKFAEPNRELLGRASACFCKNPGLAEAIRPHINVKPVYVPNGVDTALFRPRPIRVGWVGNKRDAQHLAYKGVPLIQKAIDILNEEFSGVISFEFAPDPSHYPDLVLPQAELVPYYQSLDVLVCASQAEGCSNVINEALACGVPVVSTRVGIAERLAAQKTGLLIADRRPDAIAEAIARVFAPVIERRQVMMEEYGWRSPAIRGIYLAAYQRAVEDSRK